LLGCNIGTRSRIEGIHTTLKKLGFSPQKQ
jgi:hypothetical protein